MNYMVEQQHCIPYINHNLISSHYPAMHLIHKTTIVELIKMTNFHHQRSY